MKHFLGIEVAKLENIFSLNINILWTWAKRQVCLTIN